MPGLLKLLNFDETKNSDEEKWDLINKNGSKINMICLIFFSFEIVCFLKRTEINKCAINSN